MCQTEIIPCAAGEADCDINANCSHIGPGLHVCTCVTGFVGSGQSCTDVDECASEPCEHGGRCVESSMGLMISAYLEGLSNTRALELFNPTCSAINLSHYTISMVRNGGAWGESTLSLAGSVAGGGSYVLCHTGLVAPGFSGCDASSERIRPITASAARSDAITITAFGDEK